MAGSTTAACLRRSHDLPDLFASAHIDRACDFRSADSQAVTNDFVGEI